MKPIADLPPHVRSKIKNLLRVNKALNIDLSRNEKTSMTLNFFRVDDYLTNLTSRTGFPQKTVKDAERKPQSCVEI